MAAGRETIVERLILFGTENVAVCEQPRFCSIRLVHAGTEQLSARPPAATGDLRAARGYRSASCTIDWAGCRPPWSIRNLAWIWLEEAHHSTALEGNTLVLK